MKAVILDGYAENPGDLSWDELGKYCEYTVYDRTSNDEIIERCADAEIVVTNKTPLRAETLSKLDKVKFIALLSTGYNVVDVDYCKEKSIPVCNIPTYSTEAVAQLTFAMILEHCNRVALHSDAVRSGEWTSCKDFCFWKAPLTELMSKTIGIIGYGKIGRTVAEIAKAFKMNVAVYTSHPDNSAGVSFVSLDELLEKSDFVTVHTPLTPKTTGLVNKDFLAKMKKSAMLINTSRGPAVNEQDLADALNNGTIAAAAVDVLSTEPPKADNPLLTAKNCYITPHIAWAGYETRQRLMDIFIENIASFVSGKVINCVY